MLPTSLAILATYRLAHAIAYEEGPLGACEWLRSRVDPLQATWVGRGLSCPLCLSFWLAWLLALTLPGKWILNSLGVAGGALVLHRALYGRE